MRNDVLAEGRDELTARGAEVVRENFSEEIIEF